MRAGVRALLGLAAVRAASAQAGSPSPEPTEASGGDDDGASFLERPAGIVLLAFLVVLQCAVVAFCGCLCWHRLKRKRGAPSSAGDTSDVALMGTPSPPQRLVSMQSVHSLEDKDKAVRGAGRGGYAPPAKQESQTGGTGPINDLGLGVKVESFIDLNLKSPSEDPGLGVGTAPRRPMTFGGATHSPSNTPPPANTPPPSRLSPIPAPLRRPSKQIPMFQMGRRPSSNLAKMNPTLFPRVTSPSDGGLTPSSTSRKASCEPPGMLALARRPSATSYARGSARNEVLASMALKGDADDALLAGEKEEKKEEEM